MPAVSENHADHLRRNIASLTENIVHTNNCIALAQDKAIKARMKEKNDRRMAALEQMNKSIS